MNYMPSVELQWLQQRLPHSLDADVLMVNCCWEYLVLWSKDPETIFPLTQAIAFLRCIHHATLQHGESHLFLVVAIITALLHVPLLAGLAAMVWQMFLLKKVSAAALLMEKIGKAPKDRLSRRVSSHTVLTTYSGSKLTSCLLVSRMLGLVMFLWRNSWAIQWNCLKPSCR